MLIQVGNGPDFVMMRNQEFIFHKAKISISEDGQLTVERVLADRSLASICRDIKTIWVLHSNTSRSHGYQFNSQSSPGRLQLIAASGSKSLNATLFFPESLKAIPLAEIIDMLCDYFEIANISIE